MGAFLPTYAFACPDKHVTEIMRRMSDRPGHIEKSIGCQIETFWLANEREGGYYDRSLGMQIFTESQRNAEAKKRGLTIIDGDYDTGKETLEGRQKQEELQVGYKDYFDRVHNDPAYADARAAIDRGDLPQMIKPETII